MNKSSINLTTTLTIIFVVLKLTKLITWSWVWVLSPLWITALLVLAILLFTSAVMGLVTLAVAKGKVKVTYK